MCKLAVTLPTVVVNTGQCLLLPCNSYPFFCLWTNWSTPWLSSYLGRNPLDYSNLFSAAIRNIKRHCIHSANNEYHSRLMGKSIHSHCNDVIMGTIAFQITSLTIVYSIVYSGTDQRKHQSSASLAFVRGIHRRPVNSPHKGPVTRKMFPFDDVIMHCTYFCLSQHGFP